MLPCERGALLAKAASFKKIPEDIQIKQEIDAKNIPKTIEKPIKKQSQKWCGKISKNITKKIANLTIWDPILEPIAWNVNPVDSFFTDLFFGTPEGDFGRLLEAFGLPGLD